MFPVFIFVIFWSVLGWLDHLICPHGPLYMDISYLSLLI